MMEHPWVKKLSIIFFIVWIAIGLIVLGSILYVFINKPQLPFFGSLTKTPPIENNPQQKNQSSANLGTLTEKQLLQKYNSLTQDQKDCVKSEVGEQRFNQIMSRSIKPIQDDLQKAESCIK